MVQAALSRYNCLVPNLVSCVIGVDRNMLRLRNAAQHEEQERLLHVAKRDYEPIETPVQGGNLVAGSFGNNGSGDFPDRQ